MSNDWRHREEGRLNAGDYKKLPFSFGVFKPNEHTEFGRKYQNFKEGLVLNYLHFAHVSTNNPKLVAFTETEEKGRRDIQTAMKAGKYIKRFYPGTPDEVIAYFSAMMGVQADDGKQESLIKFAKTPKEIENVYLNGPKSCMSGPPNSYASSIHPVRAYAGPDLAIGYVENSHGKPMSRCVVWPDRKIHSRIYGDGGAWDALLRAQLQKAEYKYGDIVGARLTAIPDRDGYVCPHIDTKERGDAYLKLVEDEKYLKITWDDEAGDDLYAKVTIGLTGINEDDLDYCEWCQERVAIPDGNYCAECEDNLFTCDVCGNRNHQEERVDLEKNDLLVCERCWDNGEIDQCYVCGKEDIARKLEQVRIQDGVYQDFGIFCKDCLPIECVYCKTSLTRDQQIKMDDTVLCKKCYKEVYHTCYECKLPYHDEDEDTDTEGLCKECTKEAA